MNLRIEFEFAQMLPSVLWHCWFTRQEGHPAYKKLGGMVGTS